MNSKIIILILMVGLLLPPHFSTAQEQAFSWSYEPTISIDGFSDDWQSSPIMGQAIYESNFVAIEFWAGYNFSSSKFSVSIEDSSPNSDDYLEIFIDRDSSYQPSENDLKLTMYRNQTFLVKLYNGGWKQSELEIETAFGEKQANWTIEVALATAPTNCSLTARYLDQESGNSIADAVFDNIPLEPEGEFIKYYLPSHKGDITSSIFFPVEKTIINNPINMSINLVSSFNQPILASFDLIIPSGWIFAAPSQAEVTEFSNGSHVITVSQLLNPEGFAQFQIEVEFTTPGTYQLSEGSLTVSFLNGTSMDRKITPSDPISVVESLIVSSSADYIIVTENHTEPVEESGPDFTPIVIGSAVVGMLAGIISVIVLFSRKK